MEFQIFIGIDQTGATNSKGVPKPLDACMIDCSRSRVQYFTQLKLLKITYDEISLLIKSKIPEFSNQKVLICVDSVLGLPKALKLPPAQVLLKIKNFKHLEKEYGALTAHAFFTQFLKDGVIEHREVERRVKANSVFKLKPFQRNIGCGSYRVLKELSQGEKWFDLWPYDPLCGQYAIAEGYPSYFWKTLLGSKSRDLAFLHSKFSSLQFNTIDEADSFVLAFGAMKSLAQLNLKNMHPFAPYEGWILGVPFDE